MQPKTAHTAKSTENYVIQTYLVKCFFLSSTTSNFDRIIDTVNKKIVGTHFFTTLEARILPTIDVNKKVIV